ncbi:phosphoadenosine phosphosulfate reductase family protein [Methanohalophilus sp.]|uniref:phosphoadenosine phosphosulfate reductase domain-containing protein n=1 Tax=Methanohalophilus sp. TaxID=1966352 RepID=UPI002623A8C4|nr:phosphoadenosine phosphosulfate reductase family protein [Methanohalophilus sp.]MDK2891884.1 phosphoadenosine phosphosulfate reductase [Methanohalophilus sp.]
MSKPVYLGDLLLYWCPDCNVPVLGKKCGCGKKTFHVEITPPGDIRPAFEHDIKHINRIAKEQFNRPLLPENNVVVLNKAPYDDRMDEIITDGQVIASIRYETEKLRWMMLPRIAGAKRIVATDAGELKGWVLIEDEVKKFLLKGASLLAPGVIDADPSIMPEDEVIVINSEKRVVATGRAKMSGPEMAEAKKGIAVKPRKKDKGRKTPDVAPALKNWDDVIEANSQILDKFQKEAYEFIHNTIEKVNRPLSVSYSGGKDSLATLHLVHDCTKDYEIIFADTGLEFPETLQNVKDVAEFYGKNPTVKSVGNAFWESVDDFGPPTLEMRWCCKICKLGPITQLIEDNYEKGCLTFVGQRKYESATRARSNRVWKNPWVANQTAASPIQDWTAMHVWLYILKNKLPYNPLYEKGFDRIGCWLCPSSSLADLMNLKETHPELDRRLQEMLLRHAEKMGLDPGWAEYGMWRWKKHPPAIREIADKLDITILPTRKDNTKLTFKSSSGYRPCKTGEITAEGSFSAAIDLDHILDTGMMNTIGKTAYTTGVVYIHSGDKSVQLFASGNIIARAKSEDKTKALLRKTEKNVLRALGCVGCGVCVGRCPVSAISLKEKQAYVDESCTSCGNCIDSCPVVKFR